MSPSFRQAFASSVVTPSDAAPSEATMPLPALPPRWRDDVVTHMLFDFLEDAGLASTLRALEKETGCARSRLASPRRSRGVRRSGFRISLTPPPRPSHRTPSLFSSLFPTGERTRETTRDATSSGSSARSSSTATSTPRRRSSSPYATPTTTTRRIRIIRIVVATRPRAPRSDARRSWSSSTPRTRPRRTSRDPSRSSSLC